MVPDDCGYRGVDDAGFSDSRPTSIICFFVPRADPPPVLAFMAIPMRHNDVDKAAH